MRELLPLLKLDAETSGKIGRRLRQARRRLSVPRELDVLQSLVRELRTSGRYPVRALRLVGEVVGRERVRKSNGRSAKAVAGELWRVHRKLATVGGLLTDSSDREWRWALDARLVRRASELKSVVDEAGAVYLPERLHAVRIASKKLRYTLELWAEARGGRFRAERRPLERLQEVLGRLRDLQLLIERVRAVQASADAVDVATRLELDTLVGLLEATCRRLHARYLRNRAAIVNLCARLDGRPSSRQRPGARRAG